ncbi:hypothetical protein [Streptomyces sp. NPDC052127]|uniref:hypothetical protein n=1 Tax=Streptomyces sp. NPDC052127 TaxID=3155679 RepID=UPI00342C88E9
MPYIPASPEEADGYPRPGAVNRPPGDLLRQAAQLSDAAEALVETAVIAERAKGTSWEVIGEVLGGVSKSAAQKRWGQVIAKWRETNEGHPYERHPFARLEFLEFAVANDELQEAWQKVTEVVERQPVLEGLNNATVALSGSPGVHSGTESQQIYTHLPAARLCAQDPDIDAAKAKSLLEAARRFVEDAQDREIRARGVQAVEEILARDGDRPIGHRKSAEAPGRHAEDPAEGGTNPVDHTLSPRPLSWAAGSKYRRDYTVESRRRGVQRAQAEFRAAQTLTLEERVTRLERIFEDLLIDEPAGP